LEGTEKRKDSRNAPFLKRFSSRTKRNSVRRWLRRRRGRGKNLVEEKRENGLVRTADKSVA